MGNFVHRLNAIKHDFKLAVQDVLLSHFPSVIRLRKLISYRQGMNRVLRNQLRFVDGKAKTVPQTDKKVLVPLIETNHYQYLQILILAKSLQLRGARVKVLLCDSFLDGCEIKNVKNRSLKDPCLECKFNHRYVVPHFGLEIVTLSELFSKAEKESYAALAREICEENPASYLYHGIDIIPAVRDSVIRYFYGGLPSDAELIGEITRQHTATFLINAEAMIRLRDAWSPDIVMNNMNVYSVWEPYFSLSKGGDIELFTIGMSTLDYNALVLNRMALYGSPDRFNAYLATRKSKKLSAGEKEQLQHFMQTRLAGDSQIFKDLDFFESRAQHCKQLHIDKSVKNLFLFSNIYWDVGVSESGQLFNDVVQWVLQTIELVKGCEDVHLYIKPHPGEKYNSAISLKGVSDFIHEAFPDLPGNVTIIYPEFKIKTYDLFPDIDLGIVYSGTLGLEMLLYQIPVVSTGKTTFSGLGFASEPRTLEEYAGILTGRTKAKYADRDDVELFAYFFFIKTLLPWNLTEKIYGDCFKGYSFGSLDDLLPGQNKYLDHLCNCIVDSQRNVIENWDKAEGIIRRDT